MKVQVLIPLIAAVLMPAAALATPKANAKEGHEIYESKCQMCHGPNGEGNANLAKMLQATIPPLGSKAVQAETDVQLRLVIEKGKGKMPAVAGLSATQVGDVIAFVRTLAKK